ncbi:MAG: bifunctional oligoribonuclease/PAP phosphatase NrnA [Crocinitomicaceae bacterium]
MTKEKIEQLINWVNEAQEIIITAHKSPDGDSIGSSLGLYHFIKQFNSNVTICHPDEAPYFLHWLEGYDQIQSLDKDEAKVQEAFSKADLIFCLDYNSPSRIGQMEKLMTQSSAKKVMIDHHRDPDTEFCEMMFSDITSCSTAQLIFEIIEASGYYHRMNVAVGTALYCGIVTDTGSFRFSSTLPKTHNIAAKLLEIGVEHSKVHENIYDTNTLDKIKLVSFALLEKLVVLKDLEVAYISLSTEEQNKFNANKGDTEGLVNQALAVQGVKMAIFLKESDGIVKMSFRSKGSIPVNEMAGKDFGGGGHLNASGGKFVGSLDNAIKKLVTILPKFVEEYKSHFE